MKKFWIAMLLVSLIGNALADSKLVITNPNKVIAVSPVATEVVLTLPSNPTTGYSWFLVNYDHQLLTPVSHQFIAPESKLIGAGGYQIFKFHVNNAGFLVPQLTRITLSYLRVWTIDQGSKQLTFTVATKMATQNKAP